MEQSRGGKVVLGVMLGVLALFVLLLSITVVPAGTVGVYSLFGRVADSAFQPGLYVVNPFADVVKFSVRTQEHEEEVEVPSKEGLAVALDVTVLFKLDPEHTPDVYKTLGEEYTDIIIIPQLRSITRGVTVDYEAKALYTSGRELIAEQIFKHLEPQLAERGIILETVLLRGLKLPDTVAGAIEAKLKAEQEVGKKRFELETEKVEADRKRVEAQGIADAQKIIGQSLSQSYLNWYWINQLKDQKSIIYVPIGSNGLPLFKDVDK